MAEDDPGHAGLIKRNLRRAGLSNEIVHFVNGKEVLDFLFCKSDTQNLDRNKAYLLLLDIRMPLVDGIEVLSRLKADKKLKTLPVMMLTTTDNPDEVRRCHDLGCSNYITKPIEYEQFVETLHNMALFLRIVTIPQLPKTTNS